ncbi:NmrA family NAD(P)-binding protein [Streptomyces sp. NPDC057638]|uniref:NmrA family NAD(P)-binding protein n=1 Tax=Streptomyces sp. NPDC057638 TaxID=3346190 RepID=UPI003683247A
MHYVIHGATGAQGAPVLAVLAAAGKPATALTRTDRPVADDVRTVSADYSSVTDLTRAYQGAAGVFVHLPLASEQDRLGYARNIAAAVAEARPARVVLSTSGRIVAGAGHPLLEPADGALTTLIEGLTATGVSFAVIEPRLFLENLLLPTVIGAARERGELSYPLPAGLPVSWASHRDIADAAAALFERPDITGVIEVGQDPAITGPDLAEALGARFGRAVAYRPITPEAFGTSVTPLIGADAGAGVVGLYQALGTLPHYAITPTRSARRLLGVTPRTTGQWLADLGV